jgi:hypothetical protein
MAGASALLRNSRVEFRRSRPPARSRPSPGVQPTTLVVNVLQFGGAGWHTTADALLANTSAAMAREHRQAAREYLTTAAA